VLAAGGEARDRHRLEDGERVVLQEHAVLERPGLRLVGVADQVVRAGRVGRDGLPLAAGRERGAAAPEQLGVADLTEHTLLAHLQRRAQSLVSAVRAIAVDARRVDPADAAQEPQPGVPGLRHLRVGRRGSVAAGEERCDAVGLGMPDGDLARLVAGDADHRHRRHLAHPQAGALEPDRVLARPGAVAAVLPALRPDPVLEIGAQLLRSACHAGDVGADVRHGRRLRLEREQRVERRHPIGLGRRDCEPLADVVERAGADPSGAALHGMEHREQQMPLGARRVAAASDATVAVGRGEGAHPTAVGWAEHRVDGVSLPRRRHILVQDDVHQRGWATWVAGSAASDVSAGSP
jgi:hypothetical protein